MLLLRKRDRRSRLRRRKAMLSGYAGIAIRDGSYMPPRAVPFSTAEPKAHDQLSPARPHQRAGHGKAEGRAREDGSTELTDVTPVRQSLLRFHSPLWAL